MVQDSIIKQVITANTLKTGEVVFRGEDDWVAHLEEARLYDEGIELIEEIKSHKAPHHVIGIYSIEVEVTGETIVPHHIREKIRAKGPSNYDHKRQGDTTPMRQNHVSI